MITGVRTLHAGVGRGQCDPTVVAQSPTSEARCCSCYQLTVDRWQLGEHCVGDALRDEYNAHREAGHRVGAQQRLRVGWAPLHDRNVAPFGHHFCKPSGKLILQAVPRAWGRFRVGALRRIHPHDPAERFATPE